MSDTETSGEIGPRGPAGIPGPPGPKGEQGKTGVNEYSVQCSAVKLLSPIEGIRVMTVNMTNTLGRIETICTTIRDLMDNMLDVQEHIHDAHWHGSTHYAEQGINVEPGMVFIPPKIDESSVLNNEYQNKSDKDSNGLIYGYDFIISNSDPEKPISLRSIDEVMLQNGDSIPSVQMTWQDYLATVK